MTYRCSALTCSLTCLAFVVVLLFGKNRTLLKLTWRTVTSQAAKAIALDFTNLHVCTSFDERGRSRDTRGASSQSGKNDDSSQCGSFSPH